MWVFPFLHYRHEIPLTSFDQEWWSAILGISALAILTPGEAWRNAKIPRVIQFPAALIVVVILQLALGKIVYLGQGLLYVMYLLFAAMLMMLGAWLREYFGLTRLAQALAVFLLVGATVSALIGVIQHFHWHTPLDSMILMKVSSGLYGNLAQTNHYANYIAMGLISLGLLFQQDRMKVTYVVVLAALLLFVMTLSGSRSSWLYLLMMFGLAWWGARHDSKMRPLVSYSWSLIVGFGLMHLVVQLPIMAGTENNTNTLVRLYRELLSDDAGTSSTIWIQFYMWREAWLMFQHSPWFGVGFGQFAWYHLEWLPVLKPNYIFGFYNNAHNLIFQLAAEAGLAGLMGLFGSIGVWIYGQYQSFSAFSQARVMEYEALWWSYALLGVLAIHSMLEYPLWYAYYLAIGSILLGALDETQYRLKFHHTGQILFQVVLLTGVLLLIQLNNGYQKLKEVLEISANSGDFTEASQLIRDGLVTAPVELLLRPYAELYMFMYSDMNTVEIKQKLAMGLRLMHSTPIAAVIYRQAYLLALDGEPDQAKRLLEEAIWSYPDNADAHQQLVELMEKDPAHFLALLEFANQKEQEHTRAVRQ
jgi:O-antigen ligase